MLYLIQIRFCEYKRTQERWGSGKNNKFVVFRPFKIGKLLCDEDIITKRQLNKALQVQVKGDKRTLGEILVDMGFCDFDDITNALLGSEEDTKHHEEKTKKINDIIYKNLKKNSGSVSAEHGIGLDKKKYLIKSRSEDEINLMRLIKKSIDPKNIFVHLHSQVLQHSKRQPQIDSHHLLNISTPA